MEALFESDPCFRLILMPFESDPDFPLGFGSDSDIPTDPFEPVFPSNASLAMIFSSETIHSGECQLILSQVNLLAFQQYQIQYQTILRLVQRLQHTRQQRNQLPLPEH